MECKRDHYLLWMLVALELFMSFSFLGYVHIEPISITFVYIPVLIAGCLLEPGEAALVGTIFGAASMWKASAFYVAAGDTFFSPLMSGKPVESLLLSIGTRALFGFTVGLLYKLAKSGPHPIISIVLVTSVGRTLHSAIVYIFMGALFPESGASLASTFSDAARLDFPISVLAADAIVLLCWNIYRSEYIRCFLNRIRLVDSARHIYVHNRRLMGLLLALTLAASISVAFYFTSRIRSVMQRYGVILTDQMAYDVVHLQIQFLFGILSLTVLVVIVIVLQLKNFGYLYYEARLDGLTGLLSRRQFFQTGESLLASIVFEEDEFCGCFIILDVDSFKQINDRFGHPEGDRVLKKVAEALHQALGDRGILGRLGGDEFVAFIHTPISREEIESLLKGFKKQMREVRLQDQPVTCSIGVIPVEQGLRFDDLYHGADRLLYEAKKQGKDQFVFGYRYH